MKICFFTSTLCKGGAERVISNLSNAMINNNEIEQIDIITMYNTDVEYKLDDRVKLYSLDKKYVGYKKLLNNHKGLIKFLKRVLKFLCNIKRKKTLKKMISSSDYDVIISFFPEPSFMLLSLRKYVKCPIIVSDRNDPNIEYSNVRSKWLMRRLYPLADGFVFQTTDAKKYFDNIFEKKYDIIFNPVNDKFIIERYEGKREKTIVNIAKMTNQKNQMLLIKSFEKIMEKYNDYNLIIYGEGPLRDNLQKYINNCNLKNRVFLPGKIDNVEDAIYKSSLFVLSSDYEGMPNALIEAMCLGLPVISTDCPCGGPKMLIENNKNGILVEVGNIKALSDAIEKVLNDEDFATEIGKNASKLSQIVSSDVINDKWIKFIKKIIDEKDLNN